jgi:hypothetical protein
MLMGLGSNSIFGQNPIIQTIFTADPAPMVHNDTVYLYTTHDEDVTVNNFFTMNDWRCFSSTDMVNWTDHGKVLSYKDFSWSGGDAWAGQCIYRNGKYYFYVPVTQKTGGNAIGVAVSDSPTGPFKDALGKPLLIGNGYIDPTVFIDDDGQAYLYWGNPELCYVKLNGDMISYNQQPGVVKVPLTVEGFGPRDNTDRATSYEEGPWLYKRSNLYYLIYPGGPVPEHLAYSTSASPTGPWKYGGKIMNTIANKGAFTNHPGLIDFKGKSYLFYHNAALPGGGGYNRSVCIEEFKFNNDGSIPLIAPTSGVKTAVANLNPYQLNQAETIAWEAGIETGSQQGVGVYVTNIDNNDYIKVRSVDFGTIGAASFTASVACDTKPGIAKAGSIEIHSDSANGLLIGLLPVSYTGGWANWMTETTNVSGVTGVHDVYFVFKSATDKVFNFDNWSFTEKTSSHELVAINATTEKYKIDTISGNKTTNIKVIAIYSDGSVEDVTSNAVFSPQQAGLVSIGDGLVTGTGYGTATVKVEYSGFRDEIKFIVKSQYNELAVDKLIANPENVELLSGSTKSLVVNAIFPDGHQEDVTNLTTISNPNSNIATISNGIITAKNKGEVSISVTYKGKMGESKSTSIVVKVVNRNPYIRNEAENFSQQSGIQTEACTDTNGGNDIGFIENGDWIKINALDFDNGVSSFDVRTASAGSGGKVEIHLDSQNGILAGTCNVAVTGGWQSWKTQSGKIESFNGIHDVFLVFKGVGGYLFNMNWWQFHPVVSSVSRLGNNLSLTVISKNNKKYLRGILPDDVITVFNGLGQKINTFKATSTEALLTGSSGFVIIQVNRGANTSVIKTIL